jgi:hypothetical protein
MDGMTPFTGSFDDLQREKRMANYQRSFMLPDARQRVLVQDAMLANPYNYDAAMDMERFNADASSIYGNTRRAQDLAMKRFVQEAENERKKRELAATNAVAPKPSAMVAAQGNINGQDVMVPTAGNYLNGAYQNQMQTLGLGESPTVEAYRNAMANYVSPDQKHAIKMQELENQGFLNKALMDGYWKTQTAGVKGNAPAKSLAGSDKNQSSLNQLGSNYSKYQQSLLSMAPKPSDGIPVEPGDEAYNAYVAALQAAGIPFGTDATGRVAALPQAQWMAQDPYAKGLINQMTRTPEGSRAYSEYANAVFAPPSVGASGKKAASGTRKGSAPAAQPKAADVDISQIPREALDASVGKALADGHNAEQIIRETPEQFRSIIVQSIARFRQANASQGVGNGRVRY